MVPISAYIFSGFILSLVRGTFCETLEHFFLFLYDLGWRFQTVAFEQCTQNVAATVIGDESFSRVVLPDKDFQWQVDRQRWLFQKVGCATLGFPNITTVEGGMVRPNSFAAAA